MNEEHDYQQVAMSLPKSLSPMPLRRVPVSSRLDQWRNSTEQEMSPTTRMNDSLLTRDLLSFGVQ